jgi:hypothetical protein
LSILPPAEALEAPLLTCELGLAGQTRPFTHRYGFSPGVDGFDRLAGGSDIVGNGYDEAEMMLLNVYEGRSEIY